MKKNNFLKCLCFGLLALLVGVFALIPKSSMKSAGAYNASNSVNTFPLGVHGQFQSHSLYSNFLTIENNSFTSISDSTYRSTRQIALYPYLISSDIANDLSNVAVTPSSEFNYIEFLRDYLSFYERISTEDRRRAVYLNFSVSYINNGSFVSIPFENHEFAVYALDGDEIKSYSFDDYPDSTIFIRKTPTYHENYSTASAMVNVSWVARDLGLTLFELLTNYEIYYEAYVEQGQAVTSTLSYVGLSFELYPSYIMVNLYDSGSASNVQSNIADLGYYYYISDANLIGYYENYYKSLYDDKLDKVESSAFESGYNQGYSKGLDKVSELPSTVIAFASLPFSILGGFLDFDLFGFNIYNVILALVTVFLCIWIIKKIK